MVDLIVIFVISVAIPALLVISVTIRDYFLDQHPHRRIDDHI